MTTPLIVNCAVAPPDGDTIFGDDTSGDSLLFRDDRPWDEQDMIPPGCAASDIITGDDPEGEP